MRIQLHDGTVLEVRITSTCTTIINSCKIKDDDRKKEAIFKIREAWPEAFGKRSNRSILSEWKAHNALYCHNYKIERTFTTDFEHEQKWYHALGFVIVNIFLREN